MRDAHIVLVPASLLPFKAVWLTIVRDLDATDILLILPTTPDFVRRAFERVARSFLQAGYSVTILSAERFREYCATFPDDV